MEEKTLLQISSLIEKVESRADKTWKIVVGTQELDEDQARALIKLAHRQGWFLFKETPIETSEIEDIPEVALDTPKAKTPSQRLRAVLYRWWEQNYKMKYPEFEVFYIKQMEKLIEKIKEKLE